MFLFLIGDSIVSELHSLCVGNILLTNLICPASAEILDDCSYTNYRSSNYFIRINCRTNHYDDVGVICQPSMCEVTSNTSVL